MPSSSNTGFYHTERNGTSKAWSAFDGDEEFSGLYRHNSAIFYAEPHLKSFFYYRLVLDLMQSRDLVEKSS
jgi:hypothetical protein